MTEISTATSSSPRARPWAELSGGFASAIVSLIGNVAAGVIAFAPLGPEYAGQAILAGMATSVVAGVVCALLGRTPGLVIGPKASTAMVFASLLGQLIAAGRFDLAAPEEVRVVLALCFMAVLIGGAAQSLLGGFRAGAIVTFIPYPVVAGIRNAAALLLILSQVWPFLGLSRGALWALPVRVGEVQLATALVATVTALLVWHGHRLMPRALVPAGALAAGAVLHHLIVALPADIAVGPVLGMLPSAIPTPRFAGDMLDLATSGAILPLLPIVLTGALAIAVLDAITSLISLVTFQSVADRRFDANRHLLGLGVGNMAVSMFGGLSGSAIFARSAMNHRGGGRTTLSSAANGFFVLLLLLLLVLPISLLPKAALAGLIVAVAVSMFDRWSLQLLGDAARTAWRGWILRGRTRAARQTDDEAPSGIQGQDLWAPVLEMLLVVAVGVLWNLIAAVAVGVVVAVVSFVLQMSRSPIHRVRRGSTVRSKRRRAEELMSVLESEGHRIAVVELEGTVFFGSSDAVARAIENLAADGIDYVVVDLRRVPRVDASGDKVLGQTYRRLVRQGVRLAFSHVGPEGGRGEVGGVGEGLVLTGGVDEEACFPSTDHALESFEDALLAEHADGRAARARWTIADFAEALGLDPAETDALADVASERTYAEGDLVCAAGVPGDSVFLLASGSADVTIPIPERNRSRRLATLSRGTMFGEVELLDGRPRSADVRAAESLVCYTLAYRDIHDLAARHPRVALKIYVAIGRILGERLREANDLIWELDS